MQEHSLFSTPSPAFIVCRLFDEGHSDWFEVISHCSFDLHFSNSEQPLLLTLDKGYLLTATPPDLELGIAPLGPPVPTQPPLLGGGVGPPGHRPWPWTRVAPLGRHL